MARPDRDKPGAAEPVKAECARCAQPLFGAPPFCPFCGDPQPVKPAPPPVPPPAPPTPTAKPGVTVGAVSFAPAPRPEVAPPSSPTTSPDPQPTAASAPPPVPTSASTKTKPTETAPKAPEPTVRKPASTKAAAQTFTPPPPRPRKPRTGLIAALVLGALILLAISRCGGASERALSKVADTYQITNRWTEVTIPENGDFALAADAAVRVRLGSETWFIPAGARATLGNLDSAKPVEVRTVAGRARLQVLTR